MSLARCSMACPIMALTSRMTGASLAMSRRCSRSSLACAAPTSASKDCLGALAVVLVDGVDDILFGGQRGFDLQAGEGAHGRDGIEVQRIGHGQREGGILDSQRDEAALAHEARREPFELGRRGRRRIQRDQRQAELFGERRQHVARRDEAHVDQDFAQLVAAFFLQFEGAFEIFGLDQAAGDEHLPKLRAGSGGWGLGAGDRGGVVNLELHRADGGFARGVRQQFLALGLHHDLGLGRPL
jgi:hypothetical protein